MQSANKLRPISANISATTRINLGRNVLKNQTYVRPMTKVEMIKDRTI